MARFSCHIVTISLLAILEFASGCSLSKLILEKQEPSHSPIPYIYNAATETLPDLNGLSVSGNSIIAVGDGGELIRSEDEGVSWIHEPKGGTDFLTITASYQNTIVAAGRGGLIIRSHDHGKTWEGVESRVTSDLFGSISTKSEVLVFGDKSTILRSNDDGLSWKTISFTSGTYLIRTMTVSEEGRILLLGTNSGQIFRSDDSGASWRQVWENHGAAINYIASGSDNAVRVAVGDHGTLLRSIDGGLSWLLVNTSFTRTLIQATYSQASHAFLCIGEDGILLASIDDGQSWRRIFLPLNRTLRAIQVNDNGHVFAAGLRGSVVKGVGDQFELTRGVAIRVNGLLNTQRYGLIAFGQGTVIQRYNEIRANWVPIHVESDDAMLSLTESARGLVGVGQHGMISFSSDGADWTVTNCGRDLKLNGISASPEGQYIFIAADSGIVVSSSDYGKHWTFSMPGTTDNLNAVSIASSMVYLAGDHGSLLTTDLHTQHWSVIPQNPIYNFKTVIAAPLGNHAWAFGTNGAVFYSSDNGNSWDYDDNDTSDDLLAAACLEQCKRVIAVGQHGTVVIRGNSDEKWNYLTKTRFDLRSVVASSTNMIYALGSDFKVYHPRDFNGAWQHDELGNVQNGFSSVDGKELWLVGDEGQFWHSNDGGLSWKDNPLGSAANLNNITGDDLGVHLTAVGDKGVIATSIDGGGRLDSDQSREYFSQRRAQDWQFRLGGRRPWRLAPARERIQHLEFPRFRSRYWPDGHRGY